MSAIQSNLSSAKYGYDFVVATTQASINATMKEFLAQLTEPVVTVCYVADCNGNPMAISYQELRDKANNSDPFTIPDDADPKTNQDLQNLQKTRFMMAFRARLGLPPGITADKIPDLVVLGSDTSSVTFNLLCNQFAIVQLDPGSGYTKASWMNQSQPEGHPWIFTSHVDLRLSTAEETAYGRLPPAVKEKIKNLHGTPFSVQQLLFDLDNAALQTIPDISDNVKPGTKLYEVLQRSFMAAYFQQMTSKGAPMLVCTITPQPSHDAPSTLILTDFNLEVSPFQSTNGQPDQQDLATLNYLCAANGHFLPPATRFSWNWVDASEQADCHGVVAINRLAIANYFQDKLMVYATSNCYLPKVRVFMDGLRVNYWFAMTPDQKPDVCIPPDGNEILRFHYTGEDFDQAGLNGDMGKLRLRPGYDLRVQCAQDIITITQKIEVFLFAEASGASAQGLIVNDTVTDTFTLAIGDKGQLTAQLSSKSDHNPDTPRIDDFRDFWVGGLNSVIDAISQSVAPLASQNMRDIPLSVIQDYVFPGGKTFAFKSVGFSDHQDLVSKITYTEPA